MQKVAVWCQKGGTGKSTIAAHLAYASIAVKRTLLIDTDPQASLRVAVRSGRRANK